MNVYLPEGRWILFDAGEVFEGPQTLTDFTMPLDQVPVFVGGAGILLLRDPKDDHLYAEVYSVSKEDQKASFYLKDGGNAITIENRLKGNGITNAFVRDETNGKTIPHGLDEKRKALVFIPEKNRSYTVLCN
jgi:alpha-glucosidase (family GH31 glycosyl hydrolase)